MRSLLRHGRLLAGAGALLLALSAWLLVPRPAAGGVALAPVRALLVDGSASVVRRRPDWLPWARARLLDEARAAAAAGEDVAVVVFGRDVALRLPPGPPAALLDALAGRAGPPLDPSAADDGASELAAALRVAEGLVLDARRPPGEVVLLGDGLFTGADPAPLAARLAAAGARVRRLEPPPPALPDAALSALILPRAVEAGAPLAARAELFFAPPVPPSAVLALERDGPGGPRSDVLPLAVPPEGGVLVVPVPLGPAVAGRTEVRARVVLPQGDPVPENDAAVASVAVAGELVLGAVAPPAAMSALAAWLARPAPSGGEGAALFPGLQVVLLEPGQLAGALADLDALLTFDVAPAELPAELVRSFVLRGGGWLALPGFDFLAGWTPETAEDGLGALLPLRPSPGDGGPRDVILLVDGSGSMAGEPFDLVRAAALELVSAAPPSDRLLLSFFTAGLEPARVLRGRGGELARDAERAEAARALLAARAPGGPTQLLASLAELAAERAGLATDALVLLLTDGREPGAGAGPEAAEVAQRLRAARAELRVIAVGAEADMELLRQLVAPGEELLHAADLGDLTALFQREVNRARLIEGEARAVRSRAGDGGLAAELLAPGAPPPVQRIARAELRDGATLLLADEEQHPVLAAWRAGRGRAAACATAPRAGWADAWVGDAERFGPLLRWLARGRPRDEPRASLAGGELLVEGLGPGWPPRVEATLRAAGALETGERLALALSPAHPNDPGTDRRAARLPDGLRALSAERGLELVLAGTRGEPALALSVARPPPEEFRHGRSPAVLPGVGDVRPPLIAGAAGPGEAVRGAGPWALGLGLLLLFLGGLAARRA